MPRCYRQSVLSKILYLLKGPIVVEPNIGVKLSEWGTCRNGVHVEMGDIVEIEYMLKWSTCTQCSTRFLAVYWLKNPFLNKVKGMDDRGIRHLFTYLSGF